MVKVLITANLFFDILDLDLAWSCMFALIRETVRKPDLNLDIPKMLLFALKNLSICDDEALEFHIPLLLNVICFALKVVFKAISL